MIRLPNTFSFLRVPVVINRQGRRYTIQCLLNYDIPMYFPGDTDIEVGDLAETSSDTWEVTGVRRELSHVVISVRLANPEVG